MKLSLILLMLVLFPVVYGYDYYAQQGLLTNTSRLSAYMDFNRANTSCTNINLNYPNTTLIKVENCQANYKDTSIVNNALLHQVKAGAGGGDLGWWFDTRPSVDYILEVDLNASILNAVVGYVKWIGIAGIPDPIIDMNSTHFSCKQNATVTNNYPIVLNNWYHQKIAFDDTNNKFSVWINETLLCNNVSFGSYDNNYIKVYGGWSQPFKITWDNLVMYNLTGVNPYYSAYSLGFDSQQPPDLTSTNIISSLVNITYAQSGLNISSGIIYHKVNDTISDISYYLNRSAVSGWQINQCTNISTTGYKCRLDDNEIMPASYNIAPELMENTSHSQISLSSTNQYLKIQIDNISSIRQYGFLELMANNSGSDPIRLYFCNSSYSTGNPSLSSYCAIIANIPDLAGYNHTHQGGVSSHHIIPFAIGNGQVSGIGVTPSGYFLVRGDTSSNAPSVYGIGTETRPAQMQITSNSGNAWSNELGFTADSHIHQFTNLTSLYYYVCGNRTDNNAQLCTDIRSDLLALDNLPPSMPVLFPIPAQVCRYDNISVNWTGSISPNNLSVTYNATMLGSNSILTSLLAWNKNFSESAGGYNISLFAKDSNGFSSFIDYSNNFMIVAENFSCSAYGNCSVTNTTPCLSALDGSFCAHAYTGNLSVFDASCAFCAPSWYCSNYLPCDMSNTSACLVISDYSLCNSTAPGNYSAYNLNCSYIPPTSRISSSTENLILLAIGVFLWVALLTLTFVFRSFALTGMMWIVGIVLGLFFAIYFYISIGLGFMLLSTSIFLWVASKNN
jgi:hypothetical protein